MNTFWLKVAGLAVVVLCLIIGIVMVLPSGEEPEPEPEPGAKSFYEVAEHDRERFLAEPQAVNPMEAESPTPRREPSESAGASETVSAPQQPPQKPDKITLYFSELSEIESIEAERLLNVAVPGRSIGRLPGPGFKLMVDTCRQIIQRWPDSWYAYRAQQMLIDMPERFRARYKITEDELDLSRFAKPRGGTKPFIDEESG